MVQLGSAHHLYFAFLAVDNPLRITNILGTDGNAKGAAGTGGTINGTGKDKAGADVPILANMNLVDQIRDLSLGGSNNTVSTTTRESARAGFSTNIIATSESTMTVEMVYPHVNDADVTQWTDDEKAFRALMYSFLTKREIFGVDLDGELSGTASNNEGRRGLAGNWSVGFSKNKPVEDIVTVSWELSLSSKPQWVIHDGTKFVAIA